MTIEEFNKLTNDKLYNKFKVIIDNTYKEYNFNKLDKKVYKELVLKLISIYKKKININNIDNYENIFKSDLNELIREYIKNNIHSTKEYINVINTYINNKYIVPKTYKEALIIFKDLVKMINIKNITLTPETIESLLKNNQIINETIRNVVEYNLYNIKKDGINKIFNDEKVISLIEIYCMINNIELDNDLYEDLKNDTIKEHEYTDDDLKSYLNEIDKPLLTSSQEKEIAHKVKEGDKLAKNILIERNLKLVIKIAKSYQSRTTLSLLDLIQEGNIGLMQAVDKFDVDKGYRFSTYATWWIRQSIIRGIYDKGKNIRISTHTAEKITKYYKTKRMIENETGKEATSKELADALGISEEEVGYIYNLSLDTVSTNMYINEDNDELGNYIPANTKTPAEELFEKSMVEDVRNLLDKAELTDREKAIIIYRYGLYGVKIKTLEDLGQEFGITRERTRQLENKALLKLMRYSGIKDYAEYMDDPQHAIKNMRTAKGKSYNSNHRLYKLY